MRVCEKTEDLALQNSRRGKLSCYCAQHLSQDAIRNFEERKQDTKKLTAQVVIERFPVKVPNKQKGQKLDGEY